MRKKMIKSLAQILEYSNSDILNRYEIDYASNKFESTEALKELIKFLWLSQTHESEKADYPDKEELNFICGIPEELDDMWHTLLLFTKEYLDFCTENFGKFVHHDPTGETERLTMDMSQPDFTRYFNYVRKKLGEETLHKWFNISQF
jgi:hypothetical protein